MGQPGSHSSGRGLTITWKLVLMFVGFGVGPLLIVAGIALSAVSDIEITLREKLSALSANTGETIDRNLFERYGDVQAFGMNQVVFERANWYKPSAENPIATAKTTAAATSPATMTWRGVIRR